MREHDRIVFRIDRLLQPGQFAAEVERAHVLAQIGLVCVNRLVLGQHLLATLQPAGHRFPQPLRLLGDGYVEAVDGGHLLGDLGGDA